MDCFFASVAALAEPAFKGKPLAVSHSNSAQGTGEVSSANYEARKFGIRASMFIAEAKKRCPHLIVMPYQFDKYEEVSEQVSPVLDFSKMLAGTTCNLVHSRNSVTGCVSCFCDVEVGVRSPGLRLGCATPPDTHIASLSNTQPLSPSDVHASCFVAP